MTITQKRHPRLTTTSKALALLLASGAFAACGVSTPGEGGDAADCERSDEKVIGWDFPLSTLDVYRTVNANVEAAAETRGYEVQITTNNGDLQQQVSDLQTWVTQGLPAIATYALEPSALEAVAAEAKANCVGFVSYGTDMENQDASVEFAWKGMGVALAESALAWAEKKDGPLKALILNRPATSRPASSATTASSRPSRGATRTSRWSATSRRTTARAASGSPPPFFRHTPTSTWSWPTTTTSPSAHARPSSTRERPRPTPTSGSAVRTGRSRPSRSFSTARTSSAPASPCTTRSWEARGLRHHRHRRGQDPGLPAP